ncbi:3 beta-hydroxysteroid dehydrogenase type 7 isoform X2 [Microcaecilia unicolor]|nr:3 beta-hydroxysteroid dehydrogenase type 7 isoform X2 [Microcaecilia unicolor]XP_030066226.1 3 beta-hydroxysteroid dehydrogenase type 7 isoform X2 [Microcaecilia unicolor]XP_030066227.1 3 beta-hydroxysteroid dehydrogenase type 7 isoform X2 [Microcaecilia unicolor]XP_030066228.1 3 beta-hydroxysteroid dehydrogenase type 7 isoform X2 [Microcaecilia unicolor]XP_030066230.1 3 beta-hydroxysteroid dehydrogenase type 7 isoform X2 [Microcaecilia unicolor]XP_030066231.1 3 beta-hydroxysteroid dehydrog
MAKEQQVYLVTGGCGFLGCHLVKMLVERSENIAEVKVFDLYLDENMKHLSTEKVKVTLIQGSVVHAGDVQDAMKDVDVVIHTASLVDVWGKVRPDKILEVNIHGTENVIQACIEQGTQYLVYTSSMEVVGPNMKGDSFYRGNEDTEYDVCHDKPYPVSKAKAEHLVIAANGKQIKGGKQLYTCSLRPTGIYGEKHELMKTYYEKGVQAGRRVFCAIPASIEHGRVYVGNVAWMHLLVAQKIQESPASIGGQIYYCYDHSPYKSYDDFNMEFLSACGIRMIGSRPLVPYFFLYLMAVFNELLQFLLKPFCIYAPLLNKYTLAVVSTTFTVQTDKAERHFGYRPLYSWEESKARTIHWLQSIADLHQKGN